MISMGHSMIVSTPKQDNGDRFKFYMSDRFKTVMVDHTLDTEFLKDYEELVGRELNIDDEGIEHEDSMVMELLWLFNHRMRVTDKTFEEYFQAEVNRRKEYGIMSALENYVPRGREPWVWRYYYRKTLERDINNRVWFL